MAYRSLSSDQEHAMTTDERDTSVTTITGWTPVGMHLLFVRAESPARTGIALSATNT
jgi:hypothetical protein